MTIAQITKKLGVRSCAACKYYSDQDAHASANGAIVARCLSPMSPFSARYRRESCSCDWFARGESIDLPEVTPIKRSA